MGTIDKLEARCLATAPTRRKFGHSFAVTPAPREIAARACLVESRAPATVRLLVATTLAQEALDIGDELVTLRQP